MPINREVQDQRRKAILTMLAEKPMTRQVEIGRALRKQGYKVTQSTVSRDLEALGIVRRQGVYHPPVPQGDQGGGFGKMEEFIRQVQSAGPYMLVFTTVPGMAKAVGVSIRAASWPEVKGVIAEDDTLLVVTDNVYDSRLLMQRLKRIVQT